MLVIFVKGWLIGLLISAPMGPIGMLCVQRTLNRGRWHGFVTGLGATLSDLLYSVLMLLGMSFISDFLENNQSLVLFTGSFILILFGLGVCLSHPIKNWTPLLKQEETRYKRDFLSAFLLTLSNVAIVLVMITLFARFNFHPIDQGGLTCLIAGITAIALGAISWWFFITTLLSKTRRYFNRRGLILLNRTIGSLLMLIGIAGMIVEIV